MATKVKHKKLAIEKAFKTLKPVSYTKNKIIRDLMRDQEAVVSKYMGAIKPKRKKVVKK